MFFGQLGDLHNVVNKKTKKKQISAKSIVDGILYS